MKFNDIVRFGIARTAGSGGSGVFALPQVLEQFGLRVFIEHIHTPDDLHAFWSEPAVEAQATVIALHGWGDSADKAVLNWPLLNPRSGELDDWKLTPANMGAVVQRGSGILLSLACWSGRRWWADGFFRAGFEHYVAPCSTSDTLSALQFATNFFGYLMWEERDQEPYRMEIAEAVYRARQVDEFSDGAHGFRYFGHALQNTTRSAGQLSQAR